MCHITPPLSRVGKPRVTDLSLSGPNPVFGVHSFVQSEIFISEFPLVHNVHYRVKGVENFTILIDYFTTYYFIMYITLVYHRQCIDCK